MALKDCLAASKTPGTLRVYGTPAEEGGGGKVYMIRAGLFSEVDAVLSWHPAATNDASPETTLANLSAKFRFHGKASHAAIAPEQGRSALDGLQATTYMVDMMREHVPQETRIHFISPAEAARRTWCLTSQSCTSMSDTRRTPCCGKCSTGW